jgi:hypothetical protein
MDRLPFTRPFLPPKLDGWSSASNGITPQNTGVGWISRNPNSVTSQNSGWIAAFLTNRLLSKKLLPGKKTETKITPKPIGTSPLKRLAQS